MKYLPVLVLLVNPFALSVDTFESTMMTLFLCSSSRCRGRIPSGEEESRFGYPRFRGSGRHHGPLFPNAAPPAAAPLPPHVPHAPHAPLPPHVPHAAHSPHAAHARAPPDDDALYETADAERLRDAPDSERWATLLSFNSVLTESHFQLAIQSIKF